MSGDDDDGVVMEGGYRGYLVVFGGFLVSVFLCEFICFWSQTIKSDQRSSSFVVLFCVTMCPWLCGRHSWQIKGEHLHSSTLLKRLSIHLSIFSLA